ncbi:cytochrome b5-like [Nylanderia fulva]|uniref:cytochrome b5-like n=1 Tax=Nylanderia fulva TaxID=613905 RepID=UPI0010FAF3F7|nr:cytochrome b5-like [Nylanderia fulva]
MNKYTIEEVALHKNAEDVWIIIHGSVYNVTSFLPEHPGGEEVLLGLAGQDATECFENIGHTNEAKQLRETFKIGEVTNQESATQSQITSEIRSETTGADAITADKESTVNYQDNRQTEGKFSLMMFAYLGVVVYAIIFYYYYQNM